MRSTESSADLVVIHPLDPEDASTVDRIRATVRAQKGARWRIEARQPYDALSPVTDLTLSGASYETRAETDPFFTKQQVAELVRSYLGSADANDPLASPLQGRLSGLPPIRIHVGDDEVLLDDSRRYIERAVAARVDARLDVWTGMPHGFVASIGTLKASALALDAIGLFLTERFNGRT